MKYLIILSCLFLSVNCFGQWKIEKSDWLPMGLVLGAGYSQSWRDEVEFHPNALFRHYPNLNHSFWDIREPKRWNANHVLKTATMALFTAAICVKIGDWKAYPKKKRWQKLAADALKYYGMYHIGFFIGYNLQHKNKFTF